MLRRLTRFHPVLRPVSLAVAAGLALSACAGGDGGGERTSAAVREDGRSGLAVTSALRSMAERAEREGKFSQAAAHYGRLAERLEDPLPARLDQARLLRYAGEPLKARVLLQRMLDDLPERSAETRAVRLELAKAQLAGGLVPDAAAQLEDMRARDAADPAVHKLLGIAYDRLDRPDAARRAYETALQLAPNDVETVNNYALSLAMAGDIDTGIALLAEEAARPGAPLQVRQNLALLHAMNGDLPRAERMIRGHLPEELADQAIADLRRMAGAAE